MERCRFSASLSACSSRERPWFSIDPDPMARIGQLGAPPGRENERMLTRSGELGQLERVVLRALHARCCDCQRTRAHLMHTTGALIRGVWFRDWSHPQYSRVDSLSKRRSFRRASSAHPSAKLPGSGAPKRIKTATRTIEIHPSRRTKEAPFACFPKPYNARAATPS